MNHREEGKLLNESSKELSTLAEDGTEHDVLCSTAISHLQKDVLQPYYSPHPLLPPGWERKE